MPERSRRRSIQALASICVAAAVLSACSSGPDDRTSQTQQSASASGSAPPPAPTLDAAQMQEIAAELRATVPCERADALHDDLAFWDSMRGFDCLGGKAPTFIRVYAHAASVPQTLADWDGTFGADRAVTRGAHWYVIGTPATVTSVQPPDGAPRIANDVGVPVPLTPEQDYRTTCVLYVSSEGQRYVQYPKQRSRSADQYSALFPGVTPEVHEAIDDLGLQRVQQITDKDRWIAALSPIGPRLKKQCADAYRAVGDTVHPLGGDER